MTAISLDPLDLAALLCSRVCHDVISPVGAIVNALEVLEEDDPSMREFALELIKKSARNASSRLQFARLAFGGLAHKPWRVAEAETALVQTGSADAAADAVLKGARGYGSNDFKIPLTRRTLRAVVAQATRA